MVKINYNKPQTCGKCKFIQGYTQGPYARHPHYCCELIWKLEHEDYQVNPNEIDENCPLEEE